MQLEQKDFKSELFLFPLYKLLIPLLIWAIDLVSHLNNSGQWEILVVAVCIFSKWVEAAPLPDRCSATIACWFYFQIVCHYGAPTMVHFDRGTEFWGAFSKYLVCMGIK